MARYRIQFGDREVDLPGGEMLVGRGMECHVRLRAPSVSRRHLRILQVANAVVAYDLDSRNGTFVNGAQIRGATPIADGDVVRLGTQSFTLREVQPEAEWGEEPETWETTRERAERDARAAASSEPEGVAPRTREAFAITRETVVPPEDGAEEPEGSDAVQVGEHRCAACGSPLDVGVTYCPVCAAETYSAPSYRTCPGCRALMAADERACPKCGLERPRPSLGSGARAPSDRRGAPRRAAAVRALYVSGSLTFDADVTDISHGGLFMSGDLLDPVGDRKSVV